MTNPAIDLRAARFGQVFPWPGGKRRIAADVWTRLGDPGVYLEPFFGSGSVFFCRPGDRPGRHERVNDADGLLVNAWRAVQGAPDALAKLIGGLMHDELTVGAWGRELVARRAEVHSLLLSSPRAFDMDLAAAWLQGQCLWIGDGWPNGHQKILTRPKGILAPTRQGQIPAFLAAFAKRMAGVQVSCGDWTRAVSDAFLATLGITHGIFMDPPYRGTEDAYAASDGGDVASRVEAWCLAHGTRSDLRIVLCGHQGDYALPGWTEVPWTRHRGFGNDAARDTERLWCSPACLQPGAQTTMEALYG